MNNESSSISNSIQLDYNLDYSVVFTNMGGQAVVLGLPQLKRSDTLDMIDAKDLVAVSSVSFAECGCSDMSIPGYVNGPALGLYQIAPGQVSGFIYFELLFSNYLFRICFWFYYLI